MGARLFAELNVAQHVRGFATNVANYQTIGPACPATVANSDQILNYCHSGGAGSQSNDPCCAADPCSLGNIGNSGIHEVNYIAILHHVMSSNISGFDPRFLIDTGRNGVPDARGDCSNWCNIRGAGIGQIPTAQNLPDSRIDAYYWLKTPGESDGCSQTLPNGGQCPRYDAKCGSQDSLGTTPPEPFAPEAGHWFQYQILELASNANLGPDAPGCSSTTTQQVVQTSSPTASTTISPPMDTSSPTEATTVAPPVITSAPSESTITGSPTPSPVSVGICGDGTVLTNGVCVARSFGYCGAGTTLVDGTCTKNALSCDNTGGAYTFYRNNCRTRRV